jgi:hypothetical protein
VNKQEQMQEPAKNMSQGNNNITVETPNKETTIFALAPALVNHKILDYSSTEGAKIY